LKKRLPELVNKHEMTQEMQVLRNGSRVLVRHSPNNQRECEKEKLFSVLYYEFGFQI